MSWLFSRVLVEAYSAVTCSDGAPSAPSSLTATQQAFSWLAKTTGASRRSRSGMTCEPLTDDHGAAVLTWCLADSLARTSALQGRAPASTAPAPVYGEKWRGSLAKYDRDSSSWKTPQCSLLAGLDAFSATWPRWGTMRGGECSGLATPERRISESASGSWPTPNKMDSHDHESMSSPEHWQERREAKARHGIRLQFPLRVAVRMWPDGPGAAYPKQKWPTPRKCSAMAATITCAGRARSPDSESDPPMLTPVFPAPTVNDSKNNNPPSQALRNTPPLNVAVGFNMNPMWVEWLMGWPLGWTDLHASAMDKFRQWCASHGAASD